VKIILTGGLGFIGTVTAKMLLERRHDVRVIDDRRRSIGDRLINPSWKSPWVEALKRT
jgi:nucleoside-diphosphate-sugar epimerase